MAKKKAKKKATKRRKSTGGKLDVTSVALAAGGGIVAGYAVDKVSEVQGAPDFVREHTGAVVAVVAGIAAMKIKNKRARFLLLGVAGGATMAEFAVMVAKKKQADALASLAQSAQAAGSSEAVAGVRYYDPPTATIRRAAASLGIESLGSLTTGHVLDPGVSPGLAGLTFYGDNLRGLDGLDAGIDRGDDYVDQFALAAY